MPVLVNGLWVYAVDTAFLTIAADSGKYYRLKVATTSFNLSNPACAVSNSQKVFLKVYSVKCTVLDARLLSFSGSIINDKSSLRWTSQNENDLKQYEIEKSMNGITFTKAGIVMAANNINGASYVFNDPENTTSLEYYRLKLVSRLNNQDSYSKIIMLFNQDASFKVAAVNPFVNSITLDIFLPADGAVVFNLYDLFGETVFKKTLQPGKGNSKVNLENMNRLPPGMYILRTSFNNTLLQNKLFKAN